jgi:ribosome-associated protein
MSRKERRPRTISIGNRPINLTQVLKLAGLVQSGGEAKSWIAGGVVKVNGEVELRKRRQMKVGDAISLEDGPTLVLTDGADGDESLGARS